MADEKTLFNRNSDNDDNNKQKHSIMKENEVEIVDFSSAFEDENEDFEEYEEEYEYSRPAPSFFRSLPFFRRRESGEESSVEDEKTEKPKEAEKKEIQPVKEEKEEPEDEPKLESLPEKKNKNKKNKKKKNKNKKEEISVEKEEQVESQDVVDVSVSVNDTEDKNEDLPEKKTETQEGEESHPINENITGEIIEIPDLYEESKEPTDEIIIVLDDSAETDEKNDTEEIVFIEDFEEETEELVKAETDDEIDENETIDEDENVEKKKFSRFSFLNRKTRIIPSQENIVEETVNEDSTADSKIEMIPSFEETEAIAEKVVDAEPVTEKKGTDEVVEKFEEIPPFEETVKEIVPETVENQEEFKEIPPFEETVKENIVPETVDEQEEFKEIPPFEDTVAENAVTELAVEEKEESVQKKKKKEKKVKVVESADESAENATVEPMTMKDHLTFILIILALLLTIAFIILKFIPLGNNNEQNIEINTVASENVSEIEVQRKGSSGHLIQTDIDNVFYTYSSDYKLIFYQCDDKGMKTIRPTGKVNAIVDVKNEKISVKVEYLEQDGKLFGTGIFRKTDSQGNYLHDTVVFKLVNLPKGYEEDGKALLLATSNYEAVSRSCNVWDDSFIVELETGKTTRFISSDSNMYLSYSILTNEGYASANGKIPFFTTREYDATTNKKDIYLKDNQKETRFAQDVAGSFVYTNGDTVSYLKSTDKGFNVIKNENGKENLVFALDNNTSYLYHNEYLLDKYNGILYNVRTGEKITVTGYGMSNPEMMTVSSDGRYLVVLGTVNSAIDYQVHIFDLEKNEYTKFADDNFSKHENLVFVNNTTIVYSVVEPKQGYEYVMLDVSKAFR